MLYRLIVLSGPLIGRRITIEQSPMIFGRDPSCTVSIPDEEMAKRHAAVEHKADGLQIRDLGSMNRILVNGRETRECKLKHGDEVELGRTRFLVQALVQAEVNEFRRKKRAKAVLTVAGLIALALIAAWAFQARRQKAVERAELAAAEAVRVAASNAESAAAVAATNLPATAPKPEALAATNPVSPAPPVNDDIRKMREDLGSLREMMQEIASKEIVVTNTEIVVTNPAPVITVFTSAPAAAPPAAAIETAPAVPPQIEPPAEKPEPEPKPRPAAPPHIEPPSEPVLEPWTNRPAPRAVQAAPNLRIESIEQNRFQESDDFDEMRAVSIALAFDSAGGHADPDSVRVEVSFFDQNPQSGAVVATRAIVPAAPLKVPGPWMADEVKTLTATYMVPKGFRSAEAKAGRQEQYYGFVVRVYYRGELKVSEARPKALLNYASGVHPGGKHNPAPQPAGAPKPRGAP